MQRFLSISLIFLVLLSATDTADASVFTDKNENGKTELRFSESSVDLSHDFRESNKTAFGEEEESVVAFFASKVISDKDEFLSLVQYDYYWQDHLSKRPSKKLFLDFGALII